MQVLLKDNIENLGTRGKVVTVKDGYARNYLLPKKLAVVVTKTNMRQIEIEKRRIEKIERQRMENLRSVADQLAKTSITITAAANEEGHLFGSVGSKEIVKALGQENFNIEEKAINLQEPIKEVGVYEIEAVLGENISQTFHLWIMKE